MDRRAVRRLHQRIQRGVLRKDIEGKRRQRIYPERSNGHTVHRHRVDGVLYQRLSRYTTKRVLRGVQLLRVGGHSGTGRGRPHRRRGGQIRR